jgi:hypothetical protein
LETAKVFVTLGAGFQSASPAWVATMLTVPAPVNDSAVPPEIVAGPEPTAKLTGRPLDAVAERVNTLVASCAPMAGWEIVWSSGCASRVVALAVGEFPLGPAAFSARTRK